MKSKRKTTSPSLPTKVTASTLPSGETTLPVTKTTIAPGGSLKPSRKKRILGGGKSMTQVLSRHPKIIGVEEFDLRAIQDNRELRVIADYEYAREAVRWCFNSLILEGQSEKAESIRRLLSAGPMLVSTPKGMVDADDLGHLSDMLVFWHKCAASETTPPPAMTVIKRFREFASTNHHYGPAKVFRLRDKRFAKNRLGDKFSTTFIVQVLKHPKRKPSAGEVAEAVYNLVVAEGVCEDDNGGRPKSDLLALIYLRICLGMKEPKAHLYFKEHLRPGDEGATEFGSDIYAAALGANGPSKGAWSEGLKRAHERVVRLARLFMRLLDQGHVITTR